LRLYRRTLAKRMSSGQGNHTNSIRRRRLTTPATGPALTTCRAPPAYSHGDESGVRGGLVEGHAWGEAVETTISEGRGGRTGSVAPQVDVNRQQTGPAGLHGWRLVRYPRPPCTFNLPHLAGGDHILSDRSIYVRCAYEISVRVRVRQSWRLCVAFLTLGVPVRTSCSKLFP
jgi:hypothetical protein